MRNRVFGSRPSVGGVHAGITIFRGNFERAFQRQTGSPRCDLKRGAVNQHQKPVSLGCSRLAHDLIPPSLPLWGSTYFFGGVLVSHAVVCILCSFAFFVLFCFASVLGVQHAVPRCLCLFPPVVSQDHQCPFDPVLLRPRARTYVHDHCSVRHLSSKYQCTMTHSCGSKKNMFCPRVLL